MKERNRRVMITEKGRISQARRNWTSRFRAWRTDGDNRRHYGIGAPRYAECIWIKTADVTKGLKYWNSKQSALVVHQWPQQMVTAVTELVTIRCCLEHWSQGKSWEETGLVDQMMAWIRERGRVDRLSDHDHVLKRYKELDVLYEMVLREGRLRTRNELVRGNFREEGGILVHLGPDGMPYFGGKGHHRLAIAMAAELQYFPAQLGVVHADALDSLPQYRSVHS